MNASSSCNWWLTADGVMSSSAAAAGKTIGEELARIGYAGSEPVGGYPVHAAYELHIEQGAILERAGKTIGVDALGRRHAPHARATVGMIDARPNSRNTVPGVDGLSHNEAEAITPARMCCCARCCEARRKRAADRAEAAGRRQVASRGQATSTGPWSSQ
ncbi:hypothetical protein WJ78_30030 [Burkholderia ubonensis]|nr:hypothetical protein WJ78_30030 [Burkholderia ubonensis]